MLQVSPEDIQRDKVGESSGPPPFVPFEKTAASKMLSKSTSSSSRKLPSWDSATGDGSGERPGSTGKSTAQHKNTVAIANSSQPLPKMEKGERGQEKARTSHPLPKMEKGERGQEKAKTSQPLPKMETSEGDQEKARTSHPLPKMEKGDRGQEKAKTSQPLPSMEKGDRGQEKAKNSQPLPRTVRHQEKATKDTEDRRKKASWSAREELFGREANRPVSGKQFIHSRNDKREEYATAGYSSYSASSRDVEDQETGKRSGYHVGSDRRHQKRPYGREGGRHDRQPKPYSGGHVPSEVSDRDQPSGHPQQGRQSVQRQRSDPVTLVVQGDLHERERGRNGSERRGGGKRGRRSGQSEHRSGRVELSDWMEIRTEREEQSVKATGGRDEGHHSARRGQPPGTMRGMGDHYEQQKGWPVLSSGRTGQEYDWDTVVSGHSSVPFSAKRSAAQ